MKTINASRKNPMTLDGLAILIGGLASHLDCIENRLDSLEKRFDGLEHRIDDLQFQIGDLRNHVTECVQGLANRNTSLLFPPTYAMLLHAYVFSSYTR